MRRFLLGLFLFCPWAAGAAGPKPPVLPRAEPHRSPAAIALLPDGRRALTANQTSDSVSLVDLDAGKVLAELPCGQRPVALACASDGKHAAVSNQWSGTITLLAVHGDTLTPAGTLRVGAFPHGLVFSPDGRTLYVALAGDDEVVAVDCERRTVSRRWSAPRDPRELALSADGRWLAAASTRSAQVRCWATATGKLLWERRIEDAFNLAGLTFTPDGKDLICSHQVRRDFPITRENIAKGWVIDSRLTRLARAADEPPFSWQIALDPQGQAVGDPRSPTFSPDGKWLALAGAGTHELLLLQTASIPWNAGDPGDVLDESLRDQPGKFRRIPVGGRPIQVVFRKGKDQAVVANYLRDGVQVVDLAQGKVVRFIPLGGPARPSLARQGEAIFYDAQRSHNQWFSCHSCHVEGHTCGLTFDTLNDDSYGNPKLTPSLRNVVHTGPWTWHGWQKDLGAAVQKSLTQTMFGPPPTAAETRALVAYLATLGQPPHPHVAQGRLNPAARRGQALFRGKAACLRCHQEPYYTSTRNCDVKLGTDGSPYLLWNPPSLLGLYDRGPYLHDGRARSLEELLENHHTPEHIGGQPLTAKERRELIAFLKSL